MARPRVQEQRKAEILDAYERCVIKFGVEGASLQKIADEAGLARPLIRHHVGNRDDLLDELIERFIAGSDASMAEMRKFLPGQGDMSALLDMLFNPLYRGDVQDTLLYQALTVAAQTRPPLRRRLKKWNNDFTALVQDEVTRCYPKADETASREVTLGVVALYFTLDAQGLLVPSDDDFGLARGAAERLLASLG